MNELSQDRNAWLRELEQDPVEQEIIRQGGDTKIHSDLAALKRRPDFQNRLEWWRVAHNLPMIVDCTAKLNTPLAADLPPDDEGPYDDTYEGDDLGKLPTVYRAQHSIAENIFTKKVINLLIYDTNIPDGDTVNVLFNGKTILNNLQLPIFASPRRITLTLQPSDTLPGKTNVLTVVGVKAGTGTLLSFGQTDPLITFGVKGAKGEILYRSEMAITGNGHANILPGKSATGNLALGLVCVNKIVIPPATTQHPQSAKHVEEAQAAGYPRIVTVDRPGTLARRALVNTFPAMKTCRAANKKINTGDPKTDYDCDEYPQAVFRENAGKPNVKSIRANDNRGSGTKIGYYLKAHKDENQVEVVVPVPKGKLYCKDAL